MSAGGPSGRSATRSGPATGVHAPPQWSTDLAQRLPAGQSNGTRIADIVTGLFSPPDADPEILRADLTIRSGPAPGPIYLPLAVTP